MTPAGREVLVAVAGRDWAERLRADGGIGALRGLPWVGFPPARNGGSFGEALEWLLLSAGLAGAPVATVDGLTAQLRLVEAGLGLGLLPHAAVEDGLARGTLFRVPPAAPLEASVPVVLVHRRGAYLSAAARALSEVLSAPRDAGH